MATEKIQALYDAASGKYNLGTIDEFSKKLSDPQKRKTFYDIASNDFDLGPYDEFEGKVAPPKQELPGIAQSVLQGAAQFNASLARIPAVLYAATYLPANVLGKMGVPGMGGIETPPELLDNYATRYWEQQAESNNYVKKRWKDKNLLDLAKEKKPLEAAEYLAHQVVANLPNQVPMIMAMLSGAPGVGLGLAGLTSASGEYKEAKEQSDSEINATVDAILNGVAEVAFEKAGTATIFEKWQNELAQKYGEAGAKEIWKLAIKAIGASAVGEGAEEGGTSIAQDITRYITGIDKDAFNGIMERAIESSAIGAVSGGGMTAPSAIMSGISKSISSRLSPTTRDIGGEITKDNVTVKFKGYQVDGEGGRFPLYEVVDSDHNHPLDGSTVDVKQLRKYNLPKPQEIRSPIETNNALVGRVQELERGGKSIEEMANDREIQLLQEELDQAYEREATTLSAVGKTSDPNAAGIVSTTYQYKEPQISEARRDIGVFRRFFGTPELQLEKLGVKEALDQSTKIVEQELKTSTNMAEYNDYFRTLKHKLSKGQQKKVRPIMEKIYELNRRNSIAAVQEKNNILETPEGQAANSLINWFGSMKNRIKDYYRELVKIKLPTNLNSAFNDWAENPQTFEQIAEKWGVDEEAFRSLVKNYQEIDNWGVKDYITNIERGNYKVYETTRNADGTMEEHVIAAKETRHDANQAAKEAKEGNPDANLSIRLEVAGDNPLKPTKGVMKGVENVFDILPTYAYRVENKINMGLIKEQMNQAFKADDTLPLEERVYKPGVRKLLEKQIGAASTRYNVFDKAFNDILEHRFGREYLTKVKPFGVSRAVGKIRTVQAGLKLGYRPVAAFVNKLGGEMHMHAILGAEIMRRGSAFLATSEGQQFIKDNKYLLGMDFAMEASGKANTRLPMWHPLKLFTMPEGGMREVGLASAYLKARQEGMGHEQAVRDAGRFVRFSLFTYNNTSMPAVMQGPIGRLVFQFKPYFIKEMEFISSLSPKEIVRYSGMQMLMAGPRGALHFLKTVPILGMMGLLDDIERWLEQQKLPDELPIIGGKNLMYGLVGAATGADITQAAVTQLATSPEDLLGPAVKDMIGFYKAVMGPLIHNIGAEEKNKYQYIDKRFLEWLPYTSAYAPKFMQLLDSVVGNDEIIQDMNGNDLYHINNNWDRLMLLMGAYPVEKNSKQRLLSTLNQEDRIRSDNVRWMTKEFIKKVNREKPLTDLVDAINKRLDKYEMVPSSVTQALGRYVAASYSIDDRMKNMMAMYGIGSLSGLESAVERSHQDPNIRYVLMTDLLQKARAAGILDLDQ
jgi:hypothetical protein